MTSYILCGLVVFCILVFATNVHGKKIFRCPEEYGKCNKCANHDNRVVALSRKVCGVYSQSTCRKIYDGNGGLSDDGCNGCICGVTGLTCTEIGCSAYRYDNCLSQHSDGIWKCGDSICVCTKRGLGFQHPAA